MPSIGFFALLLREWERKGGKSGTHMETRKTGEEHGGKSVHALCANKVEQSTV